MSVGVCVVNRNGLALAADSAGTFSGNKMFYNTVNKLFQISQKNICGAIIYGTLSVHSISVEQIIKEFSVYLEQQDSINDFFEIIPRFQEFIKLKNSYYKFSLDEIPFCEGLITALVEKWGVRMLPHLDKEDAEKEINDIINELESLINNTKPIDNFDVSLHIKQTYQNYYDKEINRVVPKLSSYPCCNQKLWDCICLYFNLPLDSETNTGLFFAGYGSEDAFPKYIEIKLRNIIGGEIKYTVKDKLQEYKNYAEIKPLAQEDIIYTFCKGISNDFISTLPDEMSSYVMGKIDTLPNSFSDTQKEELRNTFADCGAHMATTIATISKEKNITPLMNSVKLITLSEMAFLAENLVNITSLKRTYALDGKQQTVGGPTDVAILSKGDGFMWVKKKKYFDE